MLSQDEVKHIALLARVGLKEEEVEKYRKDLSAVLDFFRELETLPTDDVEPIGHITGTVDVARIDRVEDTSVADREAIIANIPETKSGFVKVKSVF